MKSVSMSFRVKNHNRGNIAESRANWHPGRIGTPRVSAHVSVANLWRCSGVARMFGAHGQRTLRAPGGGHSLKICDGYVRPHWPLFSNCLSLIDPFLFFTFCSHLMTRIFKMLSHLMTPFFRNIYRWKWGLCSHWMTPIFPD